LVVQEFGDELLIYDQQTDVAHCLSSVAAVVWRMCEGGASLQDIANRISVDRLGGSSAPEDAEILAQAAVTELEEKSLLIGNGPGAEGISRRHVLRRMAGVGAAALAAPLVVSAAVPKPAEAAGSPPGCGIVGATCTPPNSHNSANTCCTSTGNNCSPAGICSTCLLNGDAVTCAAPYSNTSCCSGTCASTGVCATCTTSGVAPASGCAGTPANQPNPLCCAGQCGTGSTGKTLCA
jgi:hypothetical protein